MGCYTMSEKHVSKQKGKSPYLSDGENMLRGKPQESKHLNTDKGVHRDVRKTEQMDTNKRGGPTPKRSCNAKQPREEGSGPIRSRNPYGTTVSGVPDSRVLQATIPANSCLQAVGAGVGIQIQRGIIGGIL
jgi:hypothetical protein